ncbi:hypothetical protein ACQU6D_14590 [Klebsiella variicola]|uniref:hypothetical protein n=1 Tax=Klebsiella variicola TaxID=244366 RepID=UPI003D2917F6
MAEDNLGNMVNSLLSVGGEVFNGGVLNKGTRTLSVPAGSSGNNSYIQPFIDYSSLVKFPGARLKLSIMFATSDDVIVQSPVSGDICAYNKWQVRIIPLRK